MKKKIDRKLVDADAFLKILYEGGGNMKALSTFLNQGETYIYVKVKDARRLNIGLVYQLEHYLDKTFGKGTFEDSYLEVMKGSAIGKMEERIEQVDEVKKKLLEAMKRIKDGELKVDFQRIIEEL